MKFKNTKYKKRKKSTKYKKNKKRKLKFFFLFLFLFCLFTTGFIIADQNTRATCFGDENPTFEVNFENIKDHKIEVFLLGKKHIVSF